MFWSCFSWQAVSARGTVTEGRYRATEWRAATVQIVTELTQTNSDLYFGLVDTTNRDCVLFFTFNLSTATIFKDFYLSLPIPLNVSILISEYQRLVILHYFIFIAGKPTVVKKGKTVCSNNIYGS